jgi:hypothetical protein
MGPDMGTLPSEYSAAIRSVRCAKNVFWLLTALAILAQLVVFGLVAWGGTVDALYGTSATMSRPASAPAGDKAIDRADAWRANFVWMLAVSQFLAMIMAFLLVGWLLVAVCVSLVGRLGGVASLLSAFFWSLVLLAILIPWQFTFQKSPLIGALFTYDDLYKGTMAVKTSWGAVDVSIWELVRYHVRFLAYPILAVLIWLLVNSRFRHGCREMVVTAAEPLSPQ